MGMDMAWVDMGPMAKMNKTCRSHSAIQGNNQLYILSAKPLVSLPASQVLKLINNSLSAYS